MSLDFAHLLLSFMVTGVFCKFVFYSFILFIYFIYSALFMIIFIQMFGLNCYMKDLINLYNDY